MEKVCLAAATAALLMLSFTAQEGATAGCFNYTFLNESDRADTYYNVSGDFSCDNNLSGWYRFGGRAGNQMSQTCVPMIYCNTFAPGWLNGSHPSVADGSVKRKVCFSHAAGCCSHQVDILIRNCSGFYVYQLGPPPQCKLRYCGNGLPPTPALVTSPSTTTRRTAAVVTTPSTTTRRTAGCFKYTFLNESDRADTYYNVSGEFNCDNNLSGWYRFGGKAGNQMSQTCVPMIYCNTFAPGWLNGSHPSMADGSVRRKVCFSHAAGCCSHQVDILIRNCSGFYVYHLRSPPQCKLRYCGNGVPPTPALVATPSTTTRRSAAVSNFGIVEPFPEVIYPVEFTSAQVTCIAFDSSGVKTPDRIQFARRDQFGRYTNIASSNNVYFTSRLEEVFHEGGQKLKKLFVTLHIRNVTLDDDQLGPLGRYECQAFAVGDPIERRHGFAVNVIQRSEIPTVSVSKFSVLHHGNEVTIACNVTAGQRSRTYYKKISWYKDGFRVQSVRCPDQYIPEETLGPLLVGFGSGGNYTCVLEVLLRHVTKYTVSDYTLIRDAPVCPEERLEGVSWSMTSRGLTDLKPCPNGASGTTSRKCSEEGAWKTANFTGCTSAEFKKLNDAMEAIVGGFQSDFSAQQVLSQLANISQPTKNDSAMPSQIYGGDLVVAVDILVKVAEYNAIQGNVSSTEDFENLAKVASNLLESTNSKTWNALEKAGQGRSQILVKAIDDYGLGVATTLNKSTKWKAVETTNLKMRIDRVREDSRLRVEGLEVAYKQSSIYLPPQAFSSSLDSRVVTLVYLTLNNVLPLAKESEDKDGRTVSASTTIVSSTVDPRPRDFLNKPVKAVLQNKKSDPSGTAPNKECVFWRPGESPVWKTNGCSVVTSESDIATTTCECDHLTIFAALMDPYGKLETKTHKQALEIISTVGCSISLCAVLISMAVTLFFWSVVKSPRAKVLLNLCAAIAVSCTLAIFEASARNKAGCPVAAALLHYSLLSLFSWMLCEGVLHYILLVQVFGVGAESKVKYFYMFGWGFPAIVVAISLAVTQAKGYGNEAICWLDVESGLIWAFIAPALLVILINIVVFILVIRKMMGTVSLTNRTQIERVRAGVKASAVILPLLGITWLFGLLSFSSDTIAFKYIFAIFNSLQGLMVLVFHCVLNNQIKDALRRRRGKAGRTGFAWNPNSKQTPHRKKNTPHQATQRRTDLSENNDDQPPETNDCGKISLNVSTSINEEASTDVIVHYAPPAGIVNLGLKSDS